jgi:hypothetical protein
VHAHQLVLIRKLSQSDENIRHQAIVAQPGSQTPLAK